MATTRTVGGSSWDFDAAATATMETIHKSGAVIESVFESNQTLKTLRGAKLKTIKKGGNKIRVNAMLGKNLGVASHSGWDSVNVDPQDGITAAFFDKARYSGPLAISQEEKEDNRGKEAVFNLLKEKSSQLSMSFQEKLNEHLHDVTVTAAAPGNSGKNLIPLYGLISKTPTSGVVGLIDRSNESGWRNKTKDGSGYTTFVKLKQGIVNMMNNCGRGAGGKPDIVIGDQITWEAYHNSMQEQVRYTSREKATMGFESLAIGSAEFFWDPYVADVNAGTNGGPDTTLTNGTLLFINSKFMHFACVEGSDFSTTEFVRPANQTGSVALMLFSGQLYASALRKHGVIYKLPVTFT